MRASERARAGDGLTNARARIASDRFTISRISAGGESRGVIEYWECFIRRARRETDASGESEVRENERERGEKSVWTRISRARTSARGRFTDDGYRFRAAYHRWRMVWHQPRVRRRTRGGDERPSARRMESRGAAESAVR